VTCSQVSALIKEYTKGQNSATGQEERDLLFARLFGYTSIVQSGLLVDTKSLSSSASSNTEVSSLVSYQDVIEQLFALGNSKSWLRESAWWSIGLGVQSLEQSSVSWKEAALEWTISSILSKEWSPEKVALVLKLQTYHPDYPWDESLKPTFKTADLLATSSLSTLAQILRVRHDHDIRETAHSRVGFGNRRWIE
jgi:DNA polymerase phi